MKRILNITLWVVILAGIMVLLSFINAEKKKITCKSFDVVIEYHDSDPMISPGYVEEIVYSDFDSLIGKKLSEIDLTAIEKRVNEIPFVQSAEVYASLFGNMKINAIQRQPILRVINSKNKSFYIDKTGAAVPVRSGFSCRMVVASGNIKLDYTDLENPNEEKPLGADKKLIDDLYILASYINGNEFLKAQIEQIYVSKSKEFELVPKVGRQVIYFGGIDNMEKKFSNLIAFYNKGINKKGWDKYKSINLKFDNQVVCAKK
ncbi:MAG: hypothetical protein GXO89_01115 [Chlorobi bacterium]|nr:hypothetical protein [Chlorobiota bacterium]